MANSSLCTQWHIFLWAEAPVVMPEEWFCKKSCHVLRFLVIFSRRINCWVTKTWSYLGLSGCRCWINHGSRKWTIINTVTWIFLVRCSSILPQNALSSLREFPWSQRSVLFDHVKTCLWSRIWIRDQFSSRCVISCATKLSDICFCSAW